MDVSGDEVATPKRRRVASRAPLRGDGDHEALVTRRRARDEAEAATRSQQQADADAIARLQCALYDARESAMVERRAIEAAQLRELAAVERDAHRARAEADELRAERDALRSRAAATEAHARGESRALAAAAAAAAEREEAFEASVREVRAEALASADEARAAVVALGTRDAQLAVYAETVAALHDASDCESEEGAASMSRRLARLSAQLRESIEAHARQGRRARECEARHISP